MLYLPRSLIFLLLPTKNIEVNQFLFKINTYPFNNADCLTLKFQLFYNFADCFSGWQLAAATAGHNRRSTRWTEAPAFRVFESSPRFSGPIAVFIHSRDGIRPRRTVMIPEQAAAEASWTKRSPENNPKAGRTKPPSFRPVIGIVLVNLPNPFLEPLG